MTKKSTGTECEQCPRCEQDGYRRGDFFHWCGNPYRQCPMCGKDIVNVCPCCFRPGWSSERSLVSGNILGGMACPGCRRVWPAAATAATPAPAIKPDQVIPAGKGQFWICGKCRAENTETWIIRNKSVCPKCQWSACAVPEPTKSEIKIRREASGIERTENVTLRDWNRFKRYGESAGELEDMAQQALQNWKAHLRYLAEEYSMFDEDIDDLDTAVRTMTATLHYVRTGRRPTLDEDDDDDDGFINTPARSTRHYSPWNPPSRCTAPKEHVISRRIGFVKEDQPPIVMNVQIDDISSGDL